MLRRLFAIAAAAAAVLLVTGMASPGVTGTGPIADISHACKGQNAEVEQATWHHYVYEAWMGCNGIGFARSADGGRTWSHPVTMPGSANGWDPAVAVAPEGVLYVSFMNSNNTYTYPVVDTSFNFGRTFRQPAPLRPPDRNNWGDREFTATGPHGVVYLTWDYGPSAALVHSICTPGGSCAFATGDLNVVIQKSTDYGRTWGPMVHVSPGFPASGGDSAPMVVEPGGRIDMSYQGYNIYNLKTYAMYPANTYFTSSADGGRTWSIFGVDTNSDASHVTSFNTYDLLIPPNENFGSTWLSPDEMSYAILTAAIRDGRASGKRNFEAETELARKYMVPIATLLFALLGISLGLKAARGGQSERFGVSVALFFFYYSLMRVGQTLGERGVL